MYKKSRKKTNASKTKYKHVWNTLTKMEYICGQFLIDLEIQLSQAHKLNLLITTALILTTVQRLIRLPLQSSEVTTTQPPSIPKIFSYRPVEKYTKWVCEQHRLELWNRILRNILPKFPPIFWYQNISANMLRNWLRDGYKPKQFTRLSIPDIKIILTTLYLQLLEDIYAFYFQLQFLQNLDKGAIKIRILWKNCILVNLSEFIKQLSRFRFAAWKVSRTWWKEKMIICKLHIKFL